MNDEQRDQEYQQLMELRDKLGQVMDQFATYYEEFEKHDPNEARNILFALLTKCLSEKDVAEQQPEPPLNPDDLPF